MENSKKEGHDVADEKQRTVEIVVDRITKRVRAGVWIVSALKAQVGVDASLVLAVFEGEHLKDLEDTAQITVHEGERFISHARHGSSS